MGYYSELDISRCENDWDISRCENELDIMMQNKIREYEEIHGAFDYYGFRDNSLGDAKKVEIYGITQEDLDRELEEIDKEIRDVEMEYYTIDEVIESLDLKINSMLKNDVNEAD